MYPLLQLGNRDRILICFILCSYFRAQWKARKSINEPKSEGSKKRLTSLTKHAGDTHARMRLPKALLVLSLLQLGLAKNEV
jgi:hypothetical protein